MDNYDILNKFGNFITKNLRDRAISRLNTLLDGRLQSPSTQELQKQLKKFKNQDVDIIKRCLINSIDSSIHDFLFAIQENYDFDNDINIVVNNKNIVELSDGLQGEIFLDDGWFAKFSKFGEPPEEA